MSHQLQNPAPTINSKEYTTEKGKYIALAYSEGDPLRDICENSEGWLPAMIYIRRWRAMYPAFDSMMREAASCRAENLMEDIMVIADNDKRTSSHNRNSMAAREKAIGWIAPVVPDSESPGSLDEREVYALSDEQLLTIAAGRLAIDGTSERMADNDGGVHPPVDIAPPAVYEEPDLSKPQTTPEETVVTSNEMDTGSKIPEVRSENIDTGELIPEVSKRREDTRKLIPEVPFVYEDTAPEKNNGKSEKKIFPDSEREGRRSFVGLE